MMTSLKIPRRLNYIGVFLTLRCNLKCSYCINHFGVKTSHKEMTGAQWVKGLSRIISREDVPITLQGGEPTLHPDCWEIARTIKSCGNNVDILTNGEFDINQLAYNVPVDTFNRKAKYASMRFSYHPEQMSPTSLVSKVAILLHMRYNVGIWGLDHPEHTMANDTMKVLCQKQGIDFRLKEFLGWYDGKWYGDMKYKDACNNAKMKDEVQCRTTELLISPSGYIYRCHSDLYAGVAPIGHILDENLPKLGEWRKCVGYGSCNPCDIKVKTDRFQIFGHTSVEIK